MWNANELPLANARFWLGPGVGSARSKLTLSDDRAELMVSFRERPRTGSPGHCQPYVKVRFQASSCEVECSSPALECRRQSCHAPEGTKVLPVADLRRFEHDHRAGRRRARQQGSARAQEQR